MPISERCEATCGICDSLEETLRTNAAHVRAVLADDAGPSYDASRPSLAGTDLQVDFTYEFSVQVDNFLAANSSTFTAAAAVPSFPGDASGAQDRSQVQATVLKPSVAPPLLHIAGPDAVHTSRFDAVRVYTSVQQPEIARATPKH